VDLALCDACTKDSMKLLKIIVRSCTKNVSSGVRSVFQLPSGVRLSSDGN